MTDAERLLWRALLEALPEYHWRKQVPFGPYIADFCSHGAKLIIEVDGGQHASAGAPDATRTQFLESEGYRVLRFWNNEVMENVEGVLEAIVTALSPPSRGSAAHSCPAGRGKEEARKGSHESNTFVGSRCAGRVRVSP